MSNYTTTAFKTLLAQQVYNLLDSQSNAYLPASRQNNMYFVIGQQTPWNAGSENVPTPSQTPRQLFDFYKKAIAAKKISYNNTSFVIPRRDWASGTVYRQYDCVCNLLDTYMDFYVRNSYDQVFKCLYNNKSSASTDEPIVSLSTTSLEEPFIKTSDGYKWKYMYTISSVQKQKFMTSEWMPVYSNKFVSAAAINGSIDVIDITNSGNNYIDGNLQGIISVVGDGTGAILKANVSSGHVIDVIIQDRGRDYTTANLVFTDISGGTGSSAAGTVKIVPQNGHGYDAIFELYSKTLMITLDMTDEDGVIPTDNDFRQTFLLHNPQKYGSSELAEDDVYTLYSKLKVSPGIGSFYKDEIIYQGDTLNNSSFSAEVISFDNIANELYINNIKGSLQTNLTIKGLTTGAIRVAVSATQPTLKPYSGKILHVLNKLPTQRDVDQTDKFRFLLSF